MSINDSDATEDRGPYHLNAPDLCRTGRELDLFNIGREVVLTGKEALAAREIYRALFDAMPDEPVSLCVAMQAIGTLAGVVVSNLSGAAAMAGKRAAMQSVAAGAAHMQAAFLKALVTEADMVTETPKVTLGRRA